jgi:hAT family C-terminal dimerisation region
VLIIIINILQNVEEKSADTENIFEDLLSCSSSAPRSNPALQSELDRYLSTGTENVKDPLLWWVEKKAVYPCLLCMARNYLTIPGKLY